MKNPDTLLVGFDNAHGDDAAVLIVGRKAPEDSVQIKRDQKYLVDELQSALHQMNVVMATLDTNSKEMVHMFGVKETCCTKCAHKDVCQFKEEYLAAQAAVDNVSVNLPTKDERANRYINLRNIPWIEPVELKCKHFISAAQNVAVR